MGQRLNFRARFLFDVSEADDHIGDLHTCIVDVVLNIHRSSRIAQQPDESVAENGVAQVSNVSRLVGIDARMLDQNLAGRNLDRWLPIGGEGSGHPPPVDPNIQIAGRSNMHFGDALEATDLLANCFSDFQWG